MTLIRSLQMEMPLVTLVAGGQRMIQRYEPLFILAMWEGG